MESSLLHPCPAPGEGRNVWILKSAYTCRRAGLPAEKTLTLIKDNLTRAPRPGEIERAIAKAYCINKDKVPRVTATVQASYDPVELRRVAGQIGKFGREELRKKSPILTDISAFDFLTHLYAPAERVFLTDQFTSREGVIWARHYDIQRPDKAELDFLRVPGSGNGVWFLANPITGEPLQLDRLKSPGNPLGMTVRAEENLTDFRYMVLESDHAPEELWIKALVQAPVPIVSIVTSGGASLHALVRVNARNKEQWEKIKGLIAPRFVTLGADPGAITAVRLTRLPGCYRAEKGQWQELLFLNPTAIGKPICTLPDREASGSIGGRI